MQDVFWYNSGSLLQALNPSQTLVDLTGDPAIAERRQLVPAGRDARAARCTACRSAPPFGGGILYNKDVYSKLGLQVPKTWADFMANNDKIKAAGHHAGDRDLQGHLDLAAVRARRLLQRAGRRTRTSPRTTRRTRSSTRPPRPRSRASRSWRRSRPRATSTPASARPTMAQGMKLLAAGQGRAVPHAVVRRRDADPTDRRRPRRSASSASPVTTPRRPARRSGSPAAPTSPRRARTSTLAKKFLAFMATPAGTDAFSSGTSADRARTWSRAPRCRPTRRRSPTTCRTTSTPRRSPRRWSSCPR